MIGYEFAIATIMFIPKVKMKKNRYIRTIRLFFLIGLFGVRNIATSVIIPSGLKSIYIYLRDSNSSESSKSYISPAKSSGDFP